MSRKASTSSIAGGGRASGVHQLATLYPFVDQIKQPLPSSWNAVDKFTFLGLSHDNLRVTYRGQGKTHKDAAAVRSDEPIPSACGLYYFEVKIVSKGRDGYMGIGLCQKDVSMNRLPGWDTFSYGYHGDDGNSFCSSGAGVPYGPTFTTGDVIGCALNLVDRTVFYTKNGQHLGIAFRDVVGELYPTVGLQTPNEVVDTNFGQQPFVYDIANDIKDCQVGVSSVIQTFQLPLNKKEWLNKLVSSYLVHHGLCASATAFNESAGLDCSESSSSISNRRRVQGLVLSGRVSEAIHTVQQLYPGLLQHNQLLLFTLKCGQFVEMLSGADTDAQSFGRSCPSPRSCSSTSPSSSPPHKSAAFAPPYSKSKPSSRYSPRSSPRRLKHQSPRSNTSSPNYWSGEVAGPSEMPAINAPVPAPAPDVHTNGRASSLRNEDDPAMECCSENGSTVENGSSVENGNTENGANTENGSDALNGNGDQNGTTPTEEFMDVSDSAQNVRVVSDAARKQAEAQVQAGRELLTLSNQVKSKSLAFIHQDKIMQDGFSLMAYPNLKQVPEKLKYLFQAKQRETVASALNSAILEELNEPPRAALDVVYGHSQRLRQQMSTCMLGASAFLDLDAVLKSTVMEAQRFFNITHIRLQLVH